MKLWLQILIAMVLGIGVGLVFGEQAGVLKPLGTLFIQLIRMIIVPLIFFSIIASITQMADMRALGSLSIKSVVLYLLTTACAISIGLALANIVDPGVGVTLDLAVSSVPQEKPVMNFADTLLGLVPSNPIAAMAEGNVLQIIVFAVLFGVAINMTESVRKPAAYAVNTIAEIMYSLTILVMYVAPIGVFALMAWATGTQDPQLIVALIGVMATVYGACLLQIFGVYGSMLLFIGRINPLRFFAKLVPVQLLAFTTTSSAATLPVTMKVAQEKLGVSKQTASFTLPLGATINMDGTALYQGICAVFIAQALGVTLTMQDYTTIVFTATLASIGSAAVPGVGLIMLSLVLASVGLPIEGAAIIAGIDRMLDMMRTTTNVTGDATIALVVDKTEKRLDLATLRA